MGFLGRLAQLIKSNINDLINKSEDPEKMLNQIILDMRDQLAKAKREVAAAIADALIEGGRAKGLPEHAIQLIRTTDREAVRELVGGRRVLVTGGGGSIAGSTTSCTRHWLQLTSSRPVPSWIG